MRSRLACASGTIRLTDAERQEVAEKTSRLEALENSTMAAKFRHLVIFPLTANRVRVNNVRCFLDSLAVR
jgi:hypothetical protein